MQAIGGFFELEFRKGEHYHKNALKLNTARNCLKYILKARKYNKIYIPYYTCEVILEPIQSLSIEYEFYCIDEQFNPIFHKELNKNEAFLYTNYYGLKQETVIELSKKTPNLIIDNSQAFYADPLPHIDTFYSARKFFGVPDGAYLYTDTLLEEQLKRDISYVRMSHLLKRIELSPEEAYEEFRNSECSLDQAPIKQMSLLTEKILMSLDYKSIRQARRLNYGVLADSLNKSNKLYLPLLNPADVPMVYPYLKSKADSTRKVLKENRIYIPIYWENVCKWCKETAIEFYYTKNILPLPISQHIEKKDLFKILSYLI